MANKEKTHLVLTPREMFSNNTHLGLLNKTVDYTNPREWYDSKRKASFIEEFVQEYNRSLTDIPSAREGNVAVYFALPRIQNNINTQGNTVDRKKQLSHKQQNNVLPKMTSLGSSQLINRGLDSINNAQDLSNKEHQVDADVTGESLGDKVVQESTYKGTFMTTLPLIDEIDNSETNNRGVVDRVEFPRINSTERQTQASSSGDKHNSILSVETDDKTGNNNFSSDTILASISEETKQKPEKHVTIGEIQGDQNQNHTHESVFKMESLRIIKYKESNTLPHGKCQTNIPIDRYMVLRENSNVTEPIDRLQYRLKQKSTLNVKLDHKKLDKQKSKSMCDLHKSPGKLDLSNIKSKIGHMYNSNTSFSGHNTLGESALRRYKSEILPVMKNTYILAVDAQPCVPMTRLDNAPNTREGEITGVGAIATVNTPNVQTRQELVERYNTRQGPVTYKPKESPRASVVNITIATPLRNMSRLAGWTPRNDAINEETVGPETIKPPDIHVENTLVDNDPQDTHINRSSSKASTNSKRSSNSNDNKSESIPSRLESPAKKSVHFSDNEDDSKSTTGTMSTITPSGRRSQQKPKLVLKKFNKLEVFGEYTQHKTIHYRYKSASSIGLAEEPLEYLPEKRPPQYKLDLKNYPPRKTRREMSATSEYTYTTDDSCDKTTIDAQSYLDNHSQRGAMDSQSPTRKHLSPQKPKSGFSSYKGPDPSMATYKETTVNLSDSAKIDVTSGETSTTVDVTESTFELTTSESDSDKISSIDKTDEISSITKESDENGTSKNNKSKDDNTTPKIESKAELDTNDLEKLKVSNSGLKPSVSTSDISSFTLSDTTENS